MNELQKKYVREIEELVETSVRLGQIGYVTSHGGNISFRVDNNVILITPTKVPKRKIKFDDIVIINLEGKILYAREGRQPTGEAPMHTRIFKKRPDINGLIHAHPPVLTGFAISNSNILSRPLLPEPIIEVGPILTVKYAEPISDELAASFDEIIHKSNAFLMKNHGVMICSTEGVERALELLEMIESLAFSVFVASFIGKIDEISKSHVRDLARTIKKRKQSMAGDPRFIKNITELYF